MLAKGLVRRETETAIAIYENQFHGKYGETTQELSLAYGEEGHLLSTHQHRGYVQVARGEDNDVRSETDSTERFLSQNKVELHFTFLYVLPTLEPNPQELRYHLSLFSLIIAKKKKKTKEKESLGL